MFRVFQYCKVKVSKNCWKQNSQKNKKMAKNFTSHIKDSEILLCPFHYKVWMKNISNGLIMTMHRLERKPTWSLESFNCDVPKGQERWQYTGDMVWSKAAAIWQTQDCSILFIWRCHFVFFSRVNLQLTYSCYFVKTKNNLFANLK